jgi:hypothetical protein
MMLDCLTVKTLREIGLTKGLLEHHLDVRIEGVAEGIELGRAVRREVGCHSKLGKSSWVRGKKKRVLGQDHDGFLTNGRVGSTPEGEGRGHGGSRKARRQRCTHMWVAAALLSYANRADKLLETNGS